MKRTLGVLVAAWSAAAAAQGAPVVNESTGDLVYTYEFRLPPARGRFQPRLAVSYSSSSRSHEGVGVGWKLWDMRIEKAIGASPTATGTVDRQQYWLVQGGRRELLVPFESAATYRVEVETGYLKVTKKDDGTFEATDGAGNTLQFKTAGGVQDQLLTSVTDLDGNVFDFEYLHFTPTLGKDGLGQDILGQRISALQAIKYNRRAGGTYAAAVNLGWKADGANGRQALFRVVIVGEDGTTPYRGYQLCYSAAQEACDSETAAGLEATRTVAGQLELHSISEYGGNLEGKALAAAPLRRPPTSFTYAHEQAPFAYGMVRDPADPANFKALALTAPASAGPPTAADGSSMVGDPHGGELVQELDLDGDGSLDIVWGPGTIGPSGQGGLYWARNLGAPNGGSTLSLSFGPAVKVGGFDGYSWPETEATDPPIAPSTTRRYQNVATLLDVDGNGLPDLVRTRSMECAARFGAEPTMEIRLMRKSIGAGGTATLTLDPPSCTPLGVFMPGTSWDAAGRVFPFVDYNGDGTLDGLRALDGVFARSRAWLGYWKGSDYAWVDAGPINDSEAIPAPHPSYYPYCPAPPDPFAQHAPPWCNPATETRVIDLNGDGIDDLVALPASLTDGAAAVAKVAFMQRTGAGAVNWSAPRDLKVGLANAGPWSNALCHQDPCTDQEWEQAQQGWMTCPKPPWYELVPDFTHKFRTLIDLNRDGFVDEVSLSPTVTTGLLVRWGTGTGFAQDPLESLTLEDAARVYPLVMESPGYWVTSSTTCMFHPASDLPASFWDYNLDGVLDYVSGKYGTYTVILGDPSTPMSPSLLTRVVTSERAAYAIEYSPSSAFGSDAQSLKPVVTAISMSSAAPSGVGMLAPNRVLYRYAGWTYAPAWDEPTRRDDRGFKESWSQDEFTKIVRHTEWITDAHPLAGSARLVQVGLPAGGALISAPTLPTFTWFSTTSTTFAFKQLSNSQCLSSAEPAASSYPLRAIASLTETRSYEGTVAAVVSTEVVCEVDVDADGRVKKSKTTQSFSGPGASGNQVVVVEKNAFSPESRLCKGTPEKQTTTKETASGFVLHTRTVEFDAKCRKTSSYSGVGINLETLTYDEENYGLLKTSQTGSTDGAGGTRITKTFAYDSAGLHVTTVTTSDSTTTLRSTAGFDPVTGYKTWEAGPELLAEGAPSQTGAHAPITRYFAHDLLGRQQLVAKAPFGLVADSALWNNDGLVPAISSATGVVEATLFQEPDVSSPERRSTKAFRFSTPVSLAEEELGGGLEGALLNKADAMLSIAYQDELGRLVQQRDRLGAGSAPPGGNVTKNLSAGNQYLVSKTVFLDAAGRAVGSLEPFYSSGAGFQPLSSFVPNARGSFTRLDERGRPICAFTRYVGVSVQAALADAANPDVPCVSSPPVAPGEDNPNYRLATRTSYGIRTSDPGGGGPYAGSFVEIKSWPGDTNLNEGSPFVTSLSGPGGEQYVSIDPLGNRLYVERDVLGREIASWRVSSAGTYGTPRPAGNGFGVARTAAAPKAASWTTYDVAGRVTETWDASSPKLTKQIDYDPGSGLVLAVRSMKGTEEVSSVSYTYDLGRTVDVLERVGAAAATVVSRSHYDLPYHAGDEGYGHTAGKVSWTEVPSATGAAVTTIAYGYDDAGRVTRRDQWFKRLGAGARRFTMTSSYGADGRVLDATYAGAYGVTVNQGVSYDSFGRPVKLAGALTKEVNGGIEDLRRETWWEAVDTATPDVGAYDSLGRIASMRADSGNAVSARTYDRFTGQLITEAKSVAGQVLFETAAMTYRGGKLTGYQDKAGSTNYSFAYQTDGRLQRAEGLPVGTATPLTQDFVQDYTYDGIGNLKTANETRDTRVAGRTGKTKNDLYAPTVLGVNEVGDQVARIGTVGTGPAAGTTAYTYDLRDHLTTVTQGNTVVERLWYGPGGELVTRQVGEAFTFYVGSYATVKARGATGCTTACEPVAGTEEEEAHVLLAGTRLSSVSAARTLYYYRSRLGSVVATSLNGGRAGARYRYDLYGKVMAAENETAATRSELGYTDALKLSGDLVYLKARVYDAGARVFLQADGVDRQRYAYVWGDPVNLSDPTGMEPNQYVAYGNEAQYNVPRSGWDDWSGMSMSVETRTEASTTIQINLATGEITSPVSAAETSNQSQGPGLKEPANEFLERSTAGAAAAAQYWSNKAEKEKDPGFRMLFNTLGAISSLGDKDAIGWTAATLASAGTWAAAARAAPYLLELSQAIGARFVSATAGGGAVAGGAAAAAGALGFAPGTGASAFSPSRLQHASRHLVEQKVLGPWSKATGERFIEIGAQILENPTATFDHVLRGGAAAKGFLGQVGSQNVVIFVYKAGALAGQVATAIVPSARQLANWGL